LTAPGFTGVDIVVCSVEEPPTPSHVNPRG
jgi:hypothetical protein